MSAPGSIDEAAGLTDSIAPFLQTSLFEKSPGDDLRSSNRCFGGGRVCGVGEVVEG